MGDPLAVAVVDALQESLDKDLSLALREELLLQNIVKKLTSSNDFLN